MNQSHSNGLCEPRRKLSPLEQHLANTAFLHYQALLKATDASPVSYDYKHQAWVKDGRYVACGHIIPCACYGRIHAGEPVAQDAAPAPISQLKYRPEDVFELAVIGSQLAFFLLGSEMTTCGVCGAHGGNMAEPESHHPHCKVRRWWNAVDALKIGMEVL